MRKQFRVLGLGMAATILVAACSGSTATQAPASAAPSEAPASSGASEAPASASPVAEAANVRLQLQWTPQAQFGGYFAADKQGYFADEGLTVEMVDGGPTVVAATDQIRTIRDARTETIAEIGEAGPQKMLVAAGRLKNFRACCASLKRLPKKGICIDREAAELLEADIGDTVLMVPK